MLNTIIYDTGKRPDYTRGGIKEKSSDRNPVSCPISKSAIILETFEKTIKETPQFALLSDFPLICEDWRMASRLQEILGINHEKMWGNEPYCVLGQGVLQWIEEFEKLIGEESIQAEYVAGSAASYIAGQPLLREGLDVFMRCISNEHPNKQKLQVKMAGKIAQTTFPFADVDIRIKLKSPYDLQNLKVKIDQIKGCRAELFKNKTLIVYVGEKEEKALDVIIYTQLDSECALNLDDFKVDIRKSALKKNQVVFESIDPWKWWYGATLGVYEIKTNDPVRIMQRILWQMSKGNVSNLPTDSAIYPLWLQKIHFKMQYNRDIINQQFRKQQENHDRHIPIVDCLLRLRMQQLMRDHSADSMKVMRDVAMTEVDKTVPSFIRTIFQVMNTKGSDIPAVHSLIECIAYLALYEAWKSPFEVKLVKHGGVWVQRLRFRGKFKRDLLVRFDINASLQILKKSVTTQWDKIRLILDSLRFEELSQRTTDSSYRKTLLTMTSIKAVEEIKSIFIKHTGIKNKDIVFAELAPLGKLEIDWVQESNILLEIGKMVFYHYHFNLTLRHQLCWKVVYKCIDNRGWGQAAAMVNLLREAHEDPVDGYAPLFAFVVNKGGNSELYQACSPFSQIDENRWLQLSEAKNKQKVVVELMNESNISADLFLEMIQLLRIKEYDVGESMLLKILEFDKKRACEWVRKKDKRHFATVAYNQCVSQLVMENKGSFDPIWIKDYLISKRFVGNEVDCHSLCKYLLTKPFEVKDKATLLQTLEIKDSQLWQQVANEFISQGESWPECYNQEAKINCETLVLWHQIIEHADDKAFVEETLKKIPAPKDGGRDVIRSLVLVRLLKNWEKRKVDIEILKKLDLSKKPIPWETVLHEAQTGEQILKALYNVSLALYSALFRTIKPKDPFYSTFWVRMIEAAFPLEKNEELLSALDTPLMTDCLQINPTICLPIFKRVSTTREGILFILDILPKADQEIFCLMIQASAAFDDGGTIGAKVFEKFYHPDIFPKKALNEVLPILAKKILINPQGDIETAGRIWKILRIEINSERLPSEQNLLKLIKHGYSDWVINILNKAKKEDLESLGSKIYCCLLDTIKDLEKRCLILEGCRASVISDKIRKQWENAAQSDGMTPFEGVKLLNAAEKLGVSENKVQQCALYVLSQSSNKVITIEQSVLKYLIGLISRLDSFKASELWIALMKSKLVNKIDLWKPALNIVQGNIQNPSYPILCWIIQNIQLDESKELLPLITQIIRFPLEVRILTIIFSFIKLEALKQNEKAIDLYWDLNYDENISIVDFESLKPTEDRCKKTLDRYIEISKRVDLTSSQFTFFIFLWITYRSFHKEIDLHIIYEIIASYLSKVDEEEKSICLDKILAIFLLDLPFLANSKDMQTVCRLIVNQKLGVQEQTILLNYLSKNKLLVDVQWKIISKLANEVNEISYSTVINALENLDDVDHIPARIVFLCHSFSHYFMKLNAIIEKVSDNIRKNYLQGLLLSVAFKRAESDVNAPANIRKDLANKFISYLPYISYYIDHNQKEELKEWNYVKALSYYVHEDNPKLTINYYLYAFIANIFYASEKSTFLQKEIFSQFLTFIEKYATEMHFRFILLTMVSKDILDKGNPEIAIKLVHFIAEKLCKLINNSTIPSLRPELGCGVLCTAAAIIIKYIPTNQPEIIVCLNALTAYVGYGSLPHELLLVECFVAILMLTGDCNSLAPCLPNIQADAILTAIQNLCLNPHPENLRKAHNLLLQGTNNSLFLFNQKLKEANQIYITASLNKCTTQNYQKVIPELFRHLCYAKQEDDVFAMTKENLHIQIKKMHEKGGHTVCSLNYSDEDYEIYKKQRLELINFNVHEILRRFPNGVIDNFIGILNVSIFTILKEIYISYPLHFEQLITLLKEACDLEITHSPERSSHIARKVAVLLCCHSYIPFDHWESLFEAPQLNRLLFEIKAARVYHQKLESCKEDKRTLLKLRNCNEAVDLTMTPDTYEKEVSMRFQWMSVTTTVFKADIDEFTFDWIQLIKDEMIECILLASESAIDSISSNISFIIQKVLKKLEAITNQNTQFANKWLEEFIHVLNSKVHIEKYKWLFGLIESYIGEIMTPELLPCLPHLESFSSNISQVHKKRGCIEAYYKLLSHNCNDDDIIHKAVVYSGQLLFKVGFSSQNFTGNEGSQFFLLDEKDFATKFKLVYFKGLERIVEKFKVHKNVNQFSQELHQFRGYTDVLLKQEQVQHHCIHLVIRYIYNNIESFTQNEACMKIMEYTHFVQQQLQCNLEEGLDKFADSNVLFLMIAIFCGPDADDSTSNKYLRAFSKVILPLMSMVDITSYKNEKFVKMSMKFMILEARSKDGGNKLTQTFTNIGQLAQQRTMSFADLKKLMTCSMQEQVDELVRFSSLRPELKSWYSTWIQAAIFAVSQVKEQTQDFVHEERSLRKTSHRTNVIIK